MTERIEFHILQSFAPANLNRDDTGAPKDALFGGARRGRISSQALKRAARLYMQDNGLVPPHARSYRTKRISGLLTEALTKAGVEEGTANELVLAALQTLGSGKKKLQVKDAKTDYLLFVGASELQRMADLLADYAQGLGEGKIKISADLTKALTEILTQPNKGAIDLALFGRMVANLPEANTDAACQVAHAISTHRVERDFDYYTAVDDRKPDDNAGADMIGTVEFNSSCYYRFSVVDIRQLSESLGSREQARDAVAAYAQAVVEAIPTGKQNSFAAHNPPSTVLVVKRRGQPPRNLANAFEQAVSPNGRGILEESAVRLGEYWAKVDAAFGAADQAWVLDLSGAFPGSTSAERVASLRELVDSITASLG